MPRESGPVAPEIVMSADIGGIGISFTELVTGASPEKLNEHLDVFRRAIDRQRACQMLVEVRVDLAAARETLASWPEIERKKAKERIDERVRLVASFEAAHAAANRRGDFKLNDAQRKGLQQFDKETERLKAEREADRGKTEANIPIYEARERRQLAIIAGAEKADTIGAMPEARPEAAD